MSGYQYHSASFRDPSGFVFFKDGIIYRQVNRSYARDYDLLMQSGLYTRLTEEGLLISHEEIAENITQSPDWYRTLKPRKISCISYAYEWSFELLREAALLTLKILKIALEKGMILKDANAFNIQYHEGSLIFIDSLSFEKYDPSRPWVAYRQFCGFFLFPLYLSHYIRADMQKYLSVHPEGIPVSLTARLLPAKSRFSLGPWLHVYLQNSIKTDPLTTDPLKTGPPEGNKAGVFSRKKMDDLIQHLQNEIGRLIRKDDGHSTWSNYYGETILSPQYLLEKEKLFRKFLEELPFGSALDIGANDGHFSKILAEGGKEVIAIDADHPCVDRLYRSTRGNRDWKILPLCLDVANPSPAIGFRNTERASFIQRTKTDLVAALAIAHHLVLGRNIPLEAVAALLSDLTRNYLIVEFVPLSDEKAQALIRNKDQYPKPYDETGFENCFAGHFSIEKKGAIAGSDRVLYLMRKT